MKFLTKDCIYKLTLQMFKYFLVAIIAAFVDYISFFFAYKVLGVNIYIANTFAFILGLIINYSLAIKYVFNAQTNKTFNEFVAFSLIGGVGLLISNITLYVTVDLLLIGVAIAKIIAISLTFFWNFFARKVILFNKVLNDAS